MPEWRTFAWRSAERRPIVVVHRTTAAVVAQIEALLAYRADAWAGDAVEFGQHRADDGRRHRLMGDGVRLRAMLWMHSIRMRLTVMVMVVLTLLLLLQAAQPLQGGRCRCGPMGLQLFATAAQRADTLLGGECEQTVEQDGQQIAAVGRRAQHWDGIHAPVEAECRWVEE